MARIVVNKAKRVPHLEKEIANLKELLAKAAPAPAPTTDPENF